jgi:hypothetical protein
MASEIAALAGRHKYKSSYQAIINHMIYYEKSFIQLVKEKLVTESFEKQHYKQFCDEVNNLYSDSGVDYIEDDNFDYTNELKKLENKYPNIIIRKEVTDVTEAAKHIKSISEVVNDLKEEISDIAKASNIDDIFSIEDIVKEITENQDEDIAEKVYKLIPAITGIVKEDSIMDSIINLGYDVRDYQYSYKYDTTINDINIRLYCKVDGVLYENNEPTGIVEIKNRQNAFFEPGYDLDQLACYIVASDLPIGILVQCLNDTIKIDECNTESLLNRWLDIINSHELYQSLQTIKNFRDNPYSTESLIFAKTYIV